MGGMLRFARSPVRSFDGLQMKVLKVVVMRFLTYGNPHRENSLQRYAKQDERIASFYPRDRRKKSLKKRRIEMKSGFE